MRPIVRYQRGDTLIEVMFAFAIFASIAVGSIMLMNHGVASAQRSLEITQVRAQMDAQIDAIRFIHKNYIAQYPASNAQWTKMTETYKQTSASKFGLGSSTTSCPALSSDHPFILDARQAIVQDVKPAVEAPAAGTLPPYSQVIYNADGSFKQAYGIWVEAVPSAADGNKAGFVDFHVRACWSSAGSSIPMTLGTIVRLYEPLT